MHARHRLHLLVYFEVLSKYKWNKELQLRSISGFCLLGQALLRFVQPFGIWHLTFGPWPCQIKIQSLSTCPVPPTFANDRQLDFFSRWILIKIYQQLQERDTNLKTQSHTHTHQLFKFLAELVHYTITVHPCTCDISSTLITSPVYVMIIIINKFDYSSLSQN